MLSQNVANEKLGTIIASQTMSTIDKGSFKPLSGENINGGTHQNSVLGDEVVGVGIGGTTSNPAL